MVGGEAACCRKERFSRVVASPQRARVRRSGCSRLRAPRSTATLRWHSPDLPSPRVRGSTALRRCACWHAVSVNSIPCSSSRCSCRLPDTHRSRTRSARTSSSRRCRARFAMFAMMLSVEIPDAAADAATGKRNLVVRWGVESAAIAARTFASGAVLLLLACGERRIRRAGAGVSRAGPRWPSLHGRSRSRTT